MKKIKILTLLTAFAAFAGAAVYIATAIISAKILGTSPDYSQDTFILLQDTFILLKDTRMRAIAGVFGIIISVAVMLLDIAKGYYFVRLSTGDDENFGKNKSGTIFFTVLSGVAALIAMSLRIIGKFGSFEPYFIALAALYSVATILPVIQLALFAHENKKTDNIVTIVSPTVEGIKRELDAENGETKNLSKNFEKTCKKP